MADSVLEESLAAIRARPQFVSAVRGTFAAALGFLDAAMPSERWLLKDVYGVSLMTIAVMFDSLYGRVTAALMTAVAQGNDTASANRVRLFVQQARAHGLIRIPPGPEMWTQRPLALQPPLLALWTRMCRAHIARIDLVMPEMAGLSERLADQEVFKRFWSAGGTLLLAERDLLVGEPEVAFFLDRNGGPHLLQRGAAQPDGSPARLLDRLRMSRTELAAAIGVSHPHLNLMLRDAEAKGLLEAGRDEVRFSPLLSDRYEHHHARQFEIARRTAVAAGLVSEP